MIHFGLTSEDVNNISYRLMLGRALDAVVIPSLMKVARALMALGMSYKSVVMLGRTHGQPAVPTTLGKEFANMAVWVDSEIRDLESIELTGKLTGAIGNFNALAYAVPEVDWMDFSQRFVSSFGLKPRLFNTQINRYEDMIRAFQALQRINGILHDIDQNIWRYISDGWLTQPPKRGEVGSSTMPQKVNPIDFENSEGNTEMANSILSGMSAVLPESRLQRDLTDSTVIRNVGSALAYSLIASRKTMAGLEKIVPDARAIGEQLNDNYLILSEPVQTYLKLQGVTDAYSMVAARSKGAKVGKDEWPAWLAGFDIKPEHKKTLSTLTPGSYIGYAERLVDLAAEEVSRPHKRLLCK
jgi:adenylosuccinate lyase